MTHSHSTSARQYGCPLSAAVLFMAMLGPALAGSKDGQPTTKSVDASAVHDRLYLCTGSAEPRRQFIVQVDTAKRRMQAQATRTGAQLPPGLNAGAIELDDRNWLTTPDAGDTRKELRLNGRRYACEATHND
jgi:hypothetical protein